MAIAEKVKKEVERPSPNESRDSQLKAFRELRKKLEEAGYKYGDKYESPLMQRLGWNSRKRGK